MKVLSKVFGMLITVILLALIIALPVMWLWNWLMPDIFGLIELTFWQAFGFNLLTGLVFRSTVSTSDK